MFLKPFGLGTPESRKDKAAAETEADGRDEGD